MPREGTTLFEDAIDVPLWLEADQPTPYAERVRRDRAIARGIPLSRDRIRRVRAWWCSVAPDAAEGAGARLVRLRSLATLAMTVLGAVTGVAVALTAFAYDGSKPVNVVRLLALLVGLQLVLLALTLLLLPGRVPGLRHLQDLVAAVNPGAWAAGVFRKLAHAPSEVARLFERQAARAASGRFAKWQLLYWSQVAAVVFNVAALVTTIMLVTFSDLAFGWSTTLDADPAAVTRIVQAIAWPWHTIAPQAVPSAALVEQSQFFRLEAGSGLATGSPRALGAWWRFTVFAIVTYGLLPRLALLALASLRLRAATAALLLDDPRVTALLDRMAAPEIETAAGTHDVAPPPVQIGAATAVHRPITGSAHALIWEGSLAADAARAYARRHLGLEVIDVAEAGGGRALAADRATLERLAADPAHALVVLTPAWEPPLLELLDFLAELRRRVGAEASIVVAPVPDGPRAVTDVERATWEQAIARLADPKLYVETGAA
ncbi:MAG TPA: DUF2868 domain-containing protein [Albitalea sp.]